MLSIRTCPFLYIIHTYLPTYLLDCLYTYLRYYRHRHEIDTPLSFPAPVYCARARRPETKRGCRGRSFKSLSAARTRSACRTHAITRHYTAGAIDERKKRLLLLWWCQAVIFFRSSRFSSNICPLPTCTARVR